MVLTRTQFNDELFDVAKRGTVEEMEDLLLLADVNIISLDTGRSLLHVAADNGNYEMVKYLLTRDKVNANIMDNEHNKPMLCAGKAGHYDIVKMLMPYTRARNK